MALVLILDDHGADRALMATLLRDAGFEVTITTDARDALRVLGEARPDLILLDMVIPSGFDGWFFLAQRAHHGAEDIPILIVTALNLATEMWALGLGAKGFLRKPVHADRLLGEVRRLTGMKPPSPGA
jgi:twitching motility two-component system response regulator PilH